MLGAVGYLIQALVRIDGVRYFACYLICGGAFPAVALTFAWVTDNGGSTSKRGAGLVIFGMLGLTGAIAGSRFFPKSEGPYYVKGMGISAGLLLCAAILAQILGLFLRWENKRRDAIHGVVSVKRTDSMIHSGDDHPQFRFIV